MRVINGKLYSLVVLFISAQRASIKSVRSFPKAAVRWLLKNIYWSRLDCKKISTLCVIMEQYEPGKCLDVIATGE